MSDLQSEYSRLTLAAGYVKLPYRTLVCLTGADRASFLHNFCTADIKSLQPGHVVEAFVLDGKGKTIFHVLVLALEDRTYLSGVGLQASGLVEHLDRFIIREDVQLEDQSVVCDSFFVCGNEASTKLNRMFCETPEPNHILQFDDPWRILAQVEIAGPGFLIITGMANSDLVQQELAAADLPECGQDALTAIRVINGTPWFGPDVSSENLPQELGRDDKAISFTKGCYLGQETVARIDARGHVNRLLVGLEITGDLEAAPGAELNFESNSVGRITSVSKLDCGGRQNGLGFVRRGQAKPETVLQFVGGTATVIG